MCNCCVAYVDDEDEGSVNEDESMTEAGMRRSFEVKFGSNKQQHVEANDYFVKEVYWQGSEDKQERKRRDLLQHF